jgi:hypothetical protein
MANFLEAQRRVDHMSYFSTDSAGLGEFNCGAACSCKQCRSNLAEVYEEEETPAAALPKPPAAPKIGAWFGEPPSPATPAFRFFCAAGCPHAANECIAIVRRAIREAVRLADNAAAKLEARDNEAMRLFRFFFGDPGPVQYANNRPAADLVAYRFSAVANGFRTRVPHIRCAVVSPADGDCRTATANAFVRRPGRAPTAAIPLPRNTITLCPPFWALAPHLQAGVLLHEMLHVLFSGFFGHQRNLPRPGDPAERRRDNAHCYEAFALRIAEHGADPRDVQCCRRPETC